MNLNKTLIAGNLTRDPEKKALPSGSNVTNFSVAVNRVWYKDEQKQEATEYINIVAFGKQADTIAQYFKKGSSIFVEGRMQTRSWEDKDGSKKYATEVIMENFQFVNSTKQDKPVAEKPKEEIEYPEDDIEPEDIPF